MAKKIGDVLIPLVILLFLIGGFSTFLNAADESTKVNSNVGRIIGNYEDNLSGIKTLETQLNSKISETSTFGVKTDQQVDETGRDVAGITDLLGKNIVVKFFNIIQRDLKIPAKVVWLLIAICGIIMGVILLRIVLSETRV